MITSILNPITAVYISNTHMIIVSLIFIIISIPSLAADDKLIHVHALWRHGERNPRKLFYGDLNNASAFPEGLGQLTQKGIEQLFIAGQNYRSRYIKTLNFLSSNYVHSEVYSRSSDVDRAKVSALAFFSGMLNNGKHDHQNLLPAPIPVHSIPAADDFLYLLTFKCQRMDKLWRLVDKSPEIQTLMNKSYPMLSEVSNKTKINLNFYQIVKIFEAAMLESLYGLPVPDWIYPMYSEWEALFLEYTAALWGFSAFSNSSLPFNLQHELSVFSSGSLIAEIVDRLKDKIKCQKLISEVKECEIIKAQKFYGYSSHDMTELSLFLGLGFKTFIFEKQSMPSVGSSIVLELWESQNNNIENNATVISMEVDSQYYVKIYYFQNYSVETPKYIGDLLPECQGKGCPLQYLIKRAELLRPKPDLKTLCQKPLNSSSSKLYLNFKLLLICLIVFYYA